MGDGKTGIGASPDARLTIVDGTTSQWATRVEQTNPLGYGVQFKHTGGTDFNPFFSVYDGANVDFTILNNGRVAIGENVTPDRLFVVQDNSANWAAKIQQDGTGPGFQIKHALSSPGNPAFGVYDENDNNDFVVMDDGKTGIGVSPDSRLTVVDGTTSQWAARVEQTNPLGYGVQLKHTGGTDFNPFFSVYDGSDVDFTILNNGRVGIGKNVTPDRLFVVQDNSANWAAKIQQNGTGPGFQIKHSASSAGNPAFGVYDENDNVDLVVMEDGKIGSGTNTPDVRLHVYDNSGTSGAASIKVEGNDAVGPHMDFKNNISGGKTWSVGSGGGSSSNYALGSLFFNVDGTTKMEIKSDGAVAIGTTHVPAGTKLAVEGIIAAREVKVTQATWPDYVFEDSYNLEPLSEVKKHIKEKKHLPGIPSRAEVLKQGISIGEMQHKLLQKIEEMTLHMITQEEMIVSMKKEISDLKSGN